MLLLANMNLDVPLFRPLYSKQRAYSYNRNAALLTPEEGMGGGTDRVPYLQSLLGLDIN